MSPDQPDRPDRRGGQRERRDRPPVNGWTRFSDGVGYRDHVWGSLSSLQQVVIVTLWRRHTMLPVESVRKALRQLEQRNLVTQLRDGLTERGAELARWADEQGHAQQVLDAWAGGAEERL